MIYQESTKWKEVADALENGCEQQDILIKSQETFAEDFVPDRNDSVMNRILRDTYEKTRSKVKP